MSDAVSDRRNEVAPAVACELPGTLRFGLVGGMVRERERHVLTPPDQYRRRLETFDDTTRTCSLTLPACGSPGVVDLEEILNALRHPDVVQSLSGDSTIFLGRDLRPVDGQAWRLQWFGAGEVLLGQPCGGEAGCAAIVPGLDTLCQVLERLTRETGSRCGRVGGAGGASPMGPG